MLLVFPIALLALFVAVHVALVMHGRSVVAAAAQDALAAAQIENGSLADARARAEATLDIAPGLTEVAIDVHTEDDGDTIVVTVSARVESVFLGLGSDMTSVASGPKERFYAQDER